MKASTPRDPWKPDLSPEHFRLFKKAQQKGKELQELQRQLKEQGIETTLDRTFGLRIL